MPFKLVVWDFDGTLADSLPMAVDIFNRIAPEMGFKPLEDANAARGMHMRELMRKHGISMWRLPRLVRRYQAEAAREAERLKLFPGLQPVLAAIAASNVRLGVLSSNREDNIRLCLRANAAEDYFSFVIGYPRLFGKGKALKRILHSARLMPNELLYIGDELRDVEAAKKARVKVAAVTWGFHTAELLASASPDYLISTAAELVEVTGCSPRHAAI